MTRPEHSSTIAVVGATGRQGGAVARRLLEEGWNVRALTRAPASDAARELAAAGAEVVRADMADRASLDAAFAGAYGVYSVQNTYTSGVEAEVQHGKNVADAAHDADVQHVVYGSAGTGASGTGVGSWESKLEIEAHMRTLGLALTVLRPMAFMELMTDKAFYPPVSTWHVMPKLLGASTAVPWLAVDDLAAVAVLAFAERARFVGRDLPLAADLSSIDECREIYRRIVGHRPRRFPMPVWMFNRVASSELTTMWRWWAAARPKAETDTLRAIHPNAMTVHDWLQRQRATSATPA
jgi:uncharacterized protein YbjT (DUF2867 family)